MTALRVFFSLFRSFQVFFLRSCVHSDIGIIEWPMSNPIPPPPLQPTYVANIFVPKFANVFVPMFTQCFCPNVHPMFLSRCRDASQVFRRRGFWLQILEFSDSRQSKRYCRRQRNRHRQLFEYKITKYCFLEIVNPAKEIFAAMMMIQCCRLTEFGLNSGAFEWKKTRGRESQIEMKMVDKIRSRGSKGRGR